MKSIHKFKIKYPKLQDDKLIHGTLQLHDSKEFKPEWKLILKGEVIENPISDNHEKLEKGDVIYFHYLEADEDNMVGETLFVSADKVFCYVRDGKIHTYGEFILTVPAYPENAEKIEVAGKEMNVILSKSGLVEKIDIKHSKKLTRVLYCDNNTLGIEAGDVVIMRQSSDQFYKIEGRDMFPIPPRDIIGKYLD